MRLVGLPWLKSWVGILRVACNSLVGEALHETLRIGILDDPCKDMNQSDDSISNKLE